MKQPAVTDIDFRRFDYTLADVLKPRLQLPHHIRSHQGVEVAARGMMRNTEGVAQLRSVPDLPVVMRQHGPEPPQRLRRDVNAEQRQIALQECADKILTPC